MTSPRARSDRPLASVVIPTYNDFDLLLGAIEQVKAQTWPNVETIVVDDGSDAVVVPRLARLHESYPGITVRRHLANQGVPAALQSGLEHARGKYIYFSSTNDLIEPQFLEASIDALTRHEHAGMCFSDAGTVEGWSSARRAFPLHLAPGETWFPPDKLAARLRHRPFHISTNTVVFRTKAVRAIGGCRPELGLYADWYTCMVTALRKGAVYLPRTMTYFRVHGGAYSGTARWDAGARARLAAATIRAIGAEAPEVSARLRRSAALSDFGLPVLLALMRDPHCRGVIGAEALWVALLRTGWRRMLPRGGRRLLRRVAMRPAA